MTKEGEHLEAALKRFGWECGPEFKKRYVTDPWVFNLANAVDKLTYRVEQLQGALRVVEACEAVHHAQTGELLNVASVVRHALRGGDDE